MCRSLFRFLCCFSDKDSKSSCRRSDILAVSVVVASFLINMVVEGSYNVWNVAYTTFADEFKESRFLTAWAGSVLQSTPSMFGPFASLIINRFGCRKATIAGTCIAFLGWFIGSYSNDIYFLTFTFGLIGGFGLSLAYLPSLFIVAFYYQKRLSLASSIAAAGSGVGVSVYAPLTDLLIRQFQWRGAVIIFACFFFQMIPCGILFIVPKPEENKSKETLFQPDSDTHSNTVSKIDLPSSFIMPSGSLRSSRYSSKKALIDIHRKSNKENDRTSFENARSKSQTEDKTMASTFDGDEMKLRENGKNILLRAFKINKKNKIGTESLSLSDKSTASRKPRQGILSSIPPSSNDTAYLIMHQKYVGQEVAARIVQMPAINEEQSTEQTKPAIETKHFRLNFSVLKNRVFRLFCIQSFLVFLAYDTPLMNMQGLAVSKGISSTEAAMLLSIFGIATTIGQISLGWISDLQYFDNISLYSITTIIAGISTVIVSYASSYIAFAFYCAIYGVFISANFALSTVIIVENLGRESLNEAFGICSMAEGLAILVGPPLGGYFHDLTGNYKLTFVIAGLTITISTFVFYTDSLVCLLFRKKCGQKMEEPPFVYSNG